MAERTQLQYQSIVGPVWRAPVAASLAWLPRAEQPPRARRVGRLGDFAQPPFEALYKPAFLGWQPLDRYYGRVARTVLHDWSVYPQPVAASAYDPQNLEWSPRGTAPQIPLERRRLGDFAQPPFAALYRFEGLQWQPRGIAPQIPLELRRLGDFAQPPFASLYRPEGLQWLLKGQQPARAIAFVYTGSWTIDPTALVPSPFDPARFPFQATDLVAQRQLPAILRGQYTIPELALSLPPAVVPAVDGGAATGGWPTPKVLRRRRKPAEFIARIAQEPLRDEIAIELPKRLTRLEAELVAEGLTWQLFYADQLRQEMARAKQARDEELSRLIKRDWAARELAAEQAARESAETRARASREEEGIALVVMMAALIAQSEGGNHA